MATSKRGSSLWITVGCGCLVVVALGIAAVVAAGYFGTTAVKGYVEDMKDPAARAARAAEILNAGELPAGYSALLFLHIRWLFDMVVLSDSEPLVLEGEDFDLESDAIGQHLFLYFALRKKSGMDHDELERMLRGQSTSEGVQTDIDIEFESDEELSRGSFELGAQQLSYVGHRGEIDLDDGDVDGVYSQVLIDCPDDDMTRAAVWFQRQDEPGPETPAGTPADEDELRRFMGHFDLCGAE